MYDFGKYLIVGKQQSQVYVGDHYQQVLKELVSRHFN